MVAVNDKQNKPSQRALAAALGLSPAAVTKQKLRGMPVDSIDAALAWRAKHLNVAQRKDATPAPRMPAPPAGDPPIELEESDESRDEARRRREIADANMAEIKVRQQMGQLGELGPLRAEFARQWAAVSQAMLNLPARIAPVLAAEVDVGRCQVLLDAEIRAALNQNAEAPI